MITCDALLARLDAYPRLLSGNPFIDGLLGGGLLPGFLHVIAGPGRWLARLLESLAVIAQLPARHGGAGCGKVIYALFDNRFDPYQCSQVARASGLNPAGALDRIAIARRFNWNQSVEVATRIREHVEPGALVVVSGLTSQFDPAEKSNFDGLREALSGIKRCFETEPVYAIASAPVAMGSTFKPLGGHLLYHAAGCLLAVGPRRLVTRDDRCSVPPGQAPPSRRGHDHPGRREALAAGAEWARGAAELSHVRRLWFERCGL